MSEAPIWAPCGGRRSPETDRIIVLVLDTLNSELNRRAYRRMLVDFSVGRPTRGGPIWSRRSSEVTRPNSEAADSRPAASGSLYAAKAETGITSIFW